MLAAVDVVILLVYDIVEGKKRSLYAEEFLNKENEKDFIGVRKFVCMQYTVEPLNTWDPAFCPL